MPDQKDPIQAVADSMNELLPSTHAVVNASNISGTLPNGDRFVTEFIGHKWAVHIFDSAQNERMVKTSYDERDPACAAIARSLLGDFAYKIVSGTYYSANTPDAVIRQLEWSRTTGARIRLHHGDPDTGEDWMDEWDVTGHIGRSMGPIKVPILVSSSRSLGGPAVLDNCIVRIRPAAGNGPDLYRHPSYHYGTITTEYDPHAESTRVAYRVLVDGKEHAAFESEEKRNKWLKKMGVKVEVNVAG